MEQGEYALSDREFARIKARLLAEAGIALSDAKRTLVVSRLAKILRTRGLASFDDYLDLLEQQGSAGDAQGFVNALTTNLTRFWREDHHFEHLATYVGQLLRERPRLGPDGRPRLRIWSAGCSTGQEPYTIGLGLSAAFPELKRWDFRILATDIDTQVLERAAAGVYPPAELNGLAPERAALFDRDNDGGVRIPLAIRSLVAFKPLNLMRAPWPMRGPFDAVFCRNVTIYFDRETQAGVFARLGRLLAPGGYLYIGHAEHVATGSDFKLCGKTIYQSRGMASARSAA